MVTTLTQHVRDYNPHPMRVFGGDGGIRLTGSGDRTRGNEVKARVAVDADDPVRDGDEWKVKLLLTNVGRGHARHVRVWLAEANGGELTRPSPVSKPLLSGSAPESLTLSVLDSKVSGKTAHVVRTWRDGRGDDDVEPDVSRQPLNFS